ncbi:MAG: aldo/keto reductase [Hydrogenothermaceae bacterium]|nr:aldo/keto reductase [Hydrogenothermaceae bacterium]
MIYKNFMDMSLSELGIGTYLGNPDRETSERYKQVIKTAITFGINVVDTAINYRAMESERSIGEVLQEIERDKMIISTKGGYFPQDARLNIDNISRYIQENFIDKNLFTKEDITPYGNILTPSYIDWSFEKSLENLNTNYVDVYFLHNPEDQLTICDKERFYRKIWTVFRLLEGKVSEGKLRYYGIATWNGLRVEYSHKQHINLEDIYNIAMEVGGNNHHFRFVQFPYNVAMVEAYKLKNQKIDGEFYTLFEACEKLGLYTYISAPLFQGRVLRAFPEETKRLFKVEKNSHLPIQFVRSTPGVGTVLIGTSHTEHLLENVEIEKIPKLTTQEFEKIINM